VATGPILLAGLDRSGKTQLRMALDLLPDVAWTRRVEPWTRYAGRLGDVREPALAERAIVRLSADRRLDALAPDAARLRATLPSAVDGSATGAVAESRLLGLIMAHAAAATGRSRWGLQEAGLERHLGTILDAFPDARCVVMVRDPRDRLAAVLADRSRPGAAGPTTAAWLASIRQARRARASHPDRVLIVRLEDLASKPAETLAQICGHVGATFDEWMMQPGGADPFGALRSSIGTFQRQLAPGQIALVQTLAAGTMRQLGYEPIDIPFAAADRIRYWLVDAPLGIGRLLAARARTAMTGRPA
jgi:hypothetical protein